MTERERVLRILRGEQPDKLPWYADLTYWTTALEIDGLYPEKYKKSGQDAGLHQLHRDLNAGCYLQGYEPFTANTSHAELTAAQEGNRVISTWRLQGGKELTSIAEYSSTSYSWGVIKHFIEDADDLEQYCDILEHTDYMPGYEMASQRYKTIGDNGIVLCYMPKSPLMHLIALQSGIENFTYMMADDESRVLDCLARIEHKFDEACALTLDSPAECIMIPENITSECVKPFYELMEGYHKKWTARIREKGKYSFVHQDGTVRGLVTELSERSGFDVIEAVTPFPVGDVKLEELSDLVAPSTVIWGGIPGGFFREDSLTDEAFDQHVVHCIDVMTKSPRYVLGVADQVVPGSSERRIKRVRELVDQYGVYDAEW